MVNRSVGRRSICLLGLEVAGIVYGNINGFQDDIIVSSQVCVHLFLAGMIFSYVVSTILVLCSEGCNFLLGSENSTC